MSHRVLSFGIALLLTAFGLMILWPVDFQDEGDLPARPPHDGGI